MLCTYRPFDFRPCYFGTAAMDFPRRELLEHVAGRGNLCLGLGRQGVAVQDPVWSLVSTSRYPVDANIFRRGGINIFPLYLYSQGHEVVARDSRSANFSEGFLTVLARSLNVQRSEEDGFPAGIAPEDVFHYAYGVFHSSNYRRRYAEFLKMDFPRLPLTASLHLFRSLASLGRELVALHLMESLNLNSFITIYIGPDNPEVGRVAWCGSAVWIDAPACKKGATQQPGTVGFKGVPAEVWNYHIGGYQVCEKWLKDRKGRRLCAEDIAHYQRIVVALSETIRIMGEIDRVIDEHGGWPGAFVTEPIAELGAPPLPPTPLPQGERGEAGPLPDGEGDERPFV